MTYLTALLAITCYATLGPIAKKTGLDFSPYYFIGLSSFVLGFLSFAMMFLMESKVGIVIPTTKQTWGILLFSVVNLVGYVLYLKSISQMPIAHYDMIGGLGIVLAAIIATLLLGEPWHWRYVPAVLLIIAGLYVAIMPDFK